MPESPNAVQEKIKEHLAVIRMAADTGSGTLAKLQETVDDFNKAASRQTRITIWLTVIIAIAAIFSAFSAYSTFKLTEAIYTADVGISHDNSAGVFTLKNYGKLSAAHVNIQWRQIEFGEETKIVHSGRSVIDFIYGEDRIEIPTKNIHISPHAHFILFSWNWDGVSIRNRVFVRMDGDDKWRITTEPLVDAKQWKTINKNLSEMVKI